MTLAPPTLLACPKGCPSPLDARAGAVECTDCGARYPLRGRIVDFVPETSGSVGRAQRVMESPLIAKIYEDHWRPWFTKLGGSLDYAAEEAWLRSRHAGAPAGPALDLACGTGRYARMLCTARPDAPVVGVDLSLPMLQEADRRARAAGLSNLTLARASAQRLPLRDRSFALLNCFGALHLFPEPEAALCELGRIAQDGAVFTCLTARTMPSPAARLTQRAFSRLSSFRFFDEGSLRAQLEEAGFTDYEATCDRAVLLLRAVRAPRAVVDSRS